MKCNACGRDIENTKELFLDNVNQVPYCKRCSCPRTTQSGSSNAIKELEKEDYTRFQCECGRTFYSLDFSPVCPYCGSRYCIKIG